jgi:hypothetical protein
MKICLVKILIKKSFKNTAQKNDTLGVSIIVFGDWHKFA